jgi:hypothetical protein
MKDVVRNALRDGLIFCAIGAVVALAIPPVLGMLAGLHMLGLTAAAASSFTATTASVLDSSLVFGAFGLLNNLLQPLGRFIFGEGAEQRSSYEAAKLGVVPDAKQVATSVQQAPEAREQTVVARPAAHSKKISAERILAGSDRTASR